MVIKAIKPSCHLKRSSLHLSFQSFFWWLICSQSFSMSAAYCKCVVKGFVLCWEKCVKVWILSKFWVLPKRGLSFGQNGHESYWAELSPHEEQFSFVVSVVSSVIARDCFAVKLFQLLRPLASVLWKISFFGKSKSLHKIFHSTLAIGRRHGKTLAAKQSPKDRLKQQM